MNRTKRAFTALAALFALALSGALLSSAAKPAAFRVGLMTLREAENADAFAGANAVIDKYGKAEAGGVIKHVTLPASYYDDPEAVVSAALDFAEDPLMKAIVIACGVPGSAEAFAQVRAKRPDIALYVGNTWEDAALIQKEADLIVDLDYSSRAYAIPWAAREMGAKVFVHVSFSRHMGYEILATRRDAMKRACGLLGIRFAEETCADPTTDVGVPGAQRFILESAPRWIEKYGKDTAFFCTSDACAEPLMQALLAKGGIFVESDLPNATLGYLGALGLSLEFHGSGNDYLGSARKIEAAIAAKRGAGRFGAWVYPFDYALCAGLVEHAIRVQKGESKAGDAGSLTRALADWTPGAGWSYSNYQDPLTGAPAQRHLGVFQDTYVFGKGFLLTTQLAIPDLSPLKRQ